MCHVNVKLLPPYDFNCVVGKYSFISLIMLIHQLASFTYISKLYSYFSKLCKGSRSKSQIAMNKNVCMILMHLYILQISCLGSVSKMTIGFVPFSLSEAPVGVDILCHNLFTIVL